MKLKVSEASGAALDWMVAKCEGTEPHIEPTFDGIVILTGAHSPTDYFPSANWSQGGPIIERENVAVTGTGFDAYWNCEYGWYGHMEDRYAHGPTPLIAAMRCYVASKLGDEVEVPDALIN